MVRTVLLALAWLAYAGLGFLVVVTDVVGVEFFLGNNAPTETTVAALNLSLYLCLLLAVPILIRWKFKNTSWGTFAVYFFALALALLFQAALQFDNVVAKYAYIALGVGSFAASLYFMYRNIRHIGDLVRQMRSTRPR